MVAPQFQAKFSGSSQTPGRLQHVEKGIVDRSLRIQAEQGGAARILEQA